MRKKNQKQMPLMDRRIDHPRAHELRDISQILEQNAIIDEMVLQDLTRGVELRETGAEGMSAEQVIRAAMYFGVSAVYPIYNLRRNRPFLDGH